MQNNYDVRLAEKLKRQADKRGRESAAAAELARAYPVAGVSSGTAQAETEKQPKEGK